MQDILVAIIGGLMAGMGVGYFIVYAILRRSNQRKLEEINRISDLEIEKARVSSQRMISEAEMKAEKIVSKAEQKNETIKQQKIQESRDNFARLKSDFESYKTTQSVELKERELKTLALEKEIQTKTQDIENREGEVKTLRENLDLQLKIVNKKKEELESANEKRIKELENIARMSESEAKEHLLQAVKAKATNDALIIEREVIELSLIHI